MKKQRGKPARAVRIDLEAIYHAVSGAVAKRAHLKMYLEEVLRRAGMGNVVILSGRAPIWLYLRAAHELHGRAIRLLYSAPNQNIRRLVIFDHDPG